MNQKTESLPNASADAAGKNGATETDGGKAETEEIGTGITVVNNTATTEINTANISKGQAGDIKTGMEQKSKTVADALKKCFIRSLMNELINRIGRSLF